MNKIDAGQLWNAICQAEALRAEVMPTEAECLKVMFFGYQRLRELGWREAMYMPENNQIFETISAGSTGIHKSYRDEQGRYWAFDAGDLWPSSPILFHPRGVTKSA